MIEFASMNMCLHEKPTTPETFPLYLPCPIAPNWLQVLAYAKVIDCAVENE